MSANLVKLVERALSDRHERQIELGFDPLASRLSPERAKRGETGAGVAPAAGALVVAGGVLVAAGAYQLTPLERRCLRRCRSPLGFVVHGWRGGHLGAVRMGVEHGASWWAAALG